MYRSQAINVISLSVAQTHLAFLCFAPTEVCSRQKINWNQRKELQSRKIETSNRKNPHSTENLVDDNEEQAKEKRAKT